MKCILILSHTHGLLRLAELSPAAGHLFDAK